MRIFDKTFTSLAICGALLCSGIGLATNVSAESADVSTSLGTYTFYRLGENGDHNFNLDLRAYGGYGTYKLKAFLQSPDSINLTDQTTFRYAPVVITYTGTNEAGDPMFEISYDENVTSVDLDLLSSSGNSILDEVIKVTIENPGTAGTQVVTIPAASYGLESGSYTASATAYGSKGVVSENENGGTYDESAGTITTSFSYDDNTALVYFQIIDANGKVITFADTKYEVSNPGTAGTGATTLDLSDLDLSDYDLSSFKIVTLAYPIAGSTKNVVILDADEGPVNLSVNYEKPLPPDVPDTGIFGTTINLARTDYLAVGIVGFSIVTIIALKFIHKQNRRSSRRRR